MPININAAQQAQGQQIGQAYQTLQNNLQNGVGATQNIFNNASAGVGNAYNSGMSDLQKITSDYQNRTGGHNTALGIGNNMPTTALEGGLASMLANMSGRRTTAQAALAAQGGDYAGIAQKAVGDAGQQGALAQTDSMNKLNRDLYQLQGQEEQAKSALDLRNLTGQIETTKAQAAANAAKAQGDASVRSAEINAQSRKNQMDYQMALLNSPAKQLDYAYKNARLDALLNKTPPTGTGQLAVDQFMQQNGIDPNSDEAKLYNTILSQASAKPTDPTDTRSAYDRAESEVDPQIQAVMDAADPLKATDWGDRIRREVARVQNPVQTPSRDTINTLLQLYYGKTKTH